MGDDPNVAPKINDPPAVATARPPTLDYMRPLPVEATPRTSPSPEFLAMMLVFGSAFVGGLSSGRGGVRPFCIFPVVGGTLWYVIARLSRRKRTGMFRRVGMFVATCFCIFGTAAFIIRCQGNISYEWDHPSDARDSLWFVAFGVVWFILAELGALLQRVQTNRRAAP